MNCHNCKTPNRADATYCGRCGTRLVTVLFSSDPGVTTTAATATFTATLEGPPGAPRREWVRGKGWRQVPPPSKPSAPSAPSVNHMVDIVLCLFSLATVTAILFTIIHLWLTRTP